MDNKKKVLYEFCILDIVKCKKENKNMSITSEPVDFKEIERVEKELKKIHI